jgi:nucleoside-diphosphate-sugar epimerase
MIQERAIITGATGPLGIALIELLISKGIHVTAVVREGSSRVAYLPVSPLIQVLETDLSKLMSLEKKMNQTYNVFFHLGWVFTANRLERDNVEMQQKNIQYTVDAINLARRLSCSVFIGAGSQSEYGIVNEKITDDTPLNPIEAYGVAKLSAMRVGIELCDKLGIRFGWLRILSMYGPYDRETTFISYCIKEFLNGCVPKLTLCEQEWDYIYSKDAALAFWLMYKNGKKNAVYPLSSGSSQPLKEYANTIRNVVSHKLTIAYGAIPYPKNQQMVLTADISKLMNDLSFIPQYTFEKGIREMTKAMQII